MLKVGVLLLCAWLLPVSALLPGPNVCVRTVIRTRNQTQAYTIPHIVQTHSWCIQKIHCVKNRTEYTTGYRVVSSFLQLSVEDLSCQGEPSCNGF